MSRYTPTLPDCTALLLRGDFTLDGTLVHAKAGEILPVVQWGAAKDAVQYDEGAEPIGWDSLSKGIPYLVVRLRDGGLAAFPRDSYGSVKLFTDRNLIEGAREAFEVGYDAGYSGC